MNRCLTVLPTILLLPILSACEMSTAELLDRAARAREAGELSEASIHLRNALQTDPTNLQARLELGDVMLSLNDPRGAQQQFERAISQGAQLDGYALAYCRSLVLGGSLESALEYCGDERVPEAEDEVDANQNNL